MYVSPHTDNEMTKKLGKKKVMCLTLFPPITPKVLVIKFYVGFQTFTSYFNFSFELISQQLLIVIFCFYTRLSSIELFSHLLRLSNLELGYSNSILLGFQTQVFNSQVLTQTDISLSRFPNFKPEKAIFWFTLVVHEFLHCFITILR